MHESRSTKSIHLGTAPFPQVPCPPNFSYCSNLKFCSLLNSVCQCSVQALPPALAVGKVSPFRAASSRRLVSRVSLLSGSVRCLLPENSCITYFAHFHTCLLQKDRSDSNCTVMDQKRNSWKAFLFVCFNHITTFLYLQSPLIFIG